jgi:hypothetical protein
MPETFTQIDEYAIYLLEQGKLPFEEFLYTVQRVEPTWQQQEYVDAVDRGEKRITSRSGHGPGKSFVLAQHVVWFMCSWDDAVVPITGTVFDTLKDTLWKEVVLAYRRLPDRLQDKFNLTTEALRRKTGVSYAVLRTSTKEKPEAMSGFHAPHLLLVFDEASGIPEEVFNAARGSLSTPGAIQVMAGNPTRLKGRFYDSHNKKRSLYCCLHWNSEKSPNVDPLFCREIEADWGRDSNEYRIRVLGDFPTSEEGSLIPLDIILRAVNRDLGDKWGHKKRWGLDVGGQGNDPSVLTKAEGNTVKEHVKRKKTDTMELVGVVMAELMNDGPADVKVDGTGIGEGVASRLMEQKPNIHAILNGAAPINKEKFVNIKAESFWSLRELFISGDISIIDDPDTIEQLSVITYTFNSRGQIKIMKKEDIKKVLGRSPDHAESLALTFYDPLTAGFAMAG